MLLSIELYRELTARAGSVVALLAMPGPYPGLNKAGLVRECINAFIEVQAARRLAALGGKAADIEVTPRRRDEAAE